MRDETMVVIGGGLAGATAVETLRTEGFDGRVVLISAERWLPYDRPPLTKSLLRAETAVDQATLHPQSSYDQHEIELLLGTTVTAVEPGDHRIVLADGRVVGYHRLLVATGSRARRLPVPGGELEGVVTLRTLDDALRIREALVPGHRVVVIGGGWIGCETAASARLLGCEVTVVEAGGLPLAHPLGVEIGEFYRQVHLDHGVRFVLGRPVVRLVGRRSVAAVEVDGTHLEADLVVVGIGADPSVALLTAAGAATAKGGVAADAGLRTGLPDVFVAGDIAAPMHPHFGEPVRVEHWATALHQGPAAARAMVGESVSYERVPYFYSDQYDVSMEYTGFAPTWARVVLRGDPTTGSFQAFYLDGRGRVLAGMSVNRPHPADEIGALVLGGVTPTADELRDPDIPLDHLVEPLAR